VAEPRVQKVAAAAAATGAAVVAGKLAHDKLAGDDEPNSYRLLDGETLPEGMARVARGRIRHALGQLDDGDDPDKAVHEARKDMKKLRAVLRLTRPELGDKAYRRENARFREVARRLSGVRDARAMLDALEALKEHGLHEATAARVRRELEEHKDSLARDREAVKTAVGELESARGDVADWPLERDGWDAIEPGLRRVYKQGRDRMRAAEREPTSEALHDWRKRVKDLWYHLALLRETWPAVMGPESDEAHALSQKLGDDHDLAVLWDFAVAKDLASERLRKAIETRRKELQKESFALGRRLYAERPRTFTARLASYWDAWRREPVPA
jgi:CHAD domain-containing protein